MADGTGRVARWPAVVVLGISLSVLSAASVVLGPRVVFEGDALQYSGLARSLTTGKGYVNTRSAWPQARAHDRMPGWPAVISIPMAIFPGVSEPAISRAAGVLVLSAAAAVFTFLGQYTALTPIFAIGAGLLVALSPSLVYLVVSGMAEPCMIFFYVVGLAFLLTAPGSRHPYVHAVVSGVAFGGAALTRSNMTLVPFLLAGSAVAVMATRRRVSGSLPAKGILVWWFAAAVALPCAWGVRNYTISGRPLISTMEGETLYGSNNHFVAATPMYKGYWVLPDDIPGELPKRQLARMLGTDLAVNDYYHKKAVEWASTHVSELPGLVAYKFYRAAIPWKITAEALAALAHRVVILVLAAFTFSLWWRRMHPVYIAFCCAMLLIHIITTVVYYGTLRWTHSYVEILLIIPAMFGLQEFVTRRAAVRRNAGAVAVGPD